MPNLQESNGRFWVTIPKEFVISKKWKKGKKLLMGFNEKGEIVIRE